MEIKHGDVGLADGKAALGSASGVLYGQHGEGVVGEGVVMDNLLGNEMLGSIPETPRLKEKYKNFNKRGEELWNLQTATMENLAISNLNKKQHISFPKLWLHFQGAVKAEQLKGKSRRFL